MITNKDVLMKSIQLFAHGPAYQDMSMFVDREKSKQEFSECTKNPSVSRLVIVSDLLGSGKTFLIDVATRFFTEKVDPILIRRLNESELTSRSQAPFIVIDEIDIKTPYKITEKNLKLADTMLCEISKMLVLVGDYMLRNEKVLSMISHINEKAFVKLEPLDVRFFLQATKARVKRFLEVDDEIELFDPDLLDFLVPRTEIGIATFREVLSILQGVVQELPYDTGKCCISGREVSSWFKKKIKVALDLEEKRVFYRWLMSYIREDYEKGRQNRSYVMKTLETSILRELCPIGNIKSDEEYEQMILKPFAAVNILKSLGIPFGKGEGLMDRYPSPYLPSVETFLHAKYGGAS